MSLFDVVASLALAQETTALSGILPNTVGIVTGLCALGAGAKCCAASIDRSLAAFLASASALC
jgi:hypothetical protein